MKTYQLTFLTKDSHISVPGTFPTLKQCREVALPGNAIERQIIECAIVPMRLVIKEKVNAK